MNAKHTPGPWKIRRVTHYDIRIAPESEPEHVSIAGMAIWGEEHREELEANARLIAAAPELLEALKDCVQWLTAFAKGTGNEIIRETDRYQKYVSAIRSAEGGES